MKKPLLPIPVTRVGSAVTPPPVFVPAGQARQPPAGATRAPAPFQPFASAQPVQAKAAGSVLFRPALPIRQPAPSPHPAAAKSMNPALPRTLPMQARGPGALIQRAEEKTPENGFAPSLGIGARKRLKVTAARSYTSRSTAAARAALAVDDMPAAAAAAAAAQPAAAAASRLPIYKKPKEKGYWNDTRPPFLETTWTSLWMEGGSKKDDKGAHLFTCKNCEQDFYRKGTKKRESFASIDHVRDWQTHIELKAAPDGAGKITQAAAQAAYNDLSNLVILCNRCNSSKGGPKGSRA